MTRHQAYHVACAVALSAAFVAPAFGQSAPLPAPDTKYTNSFVPNPGDVVLRIFPTSSQNQIYDRFHVDNATLEMEHLAPAQLSARYPAQLANVQPGAMTTDNNILGVVVWGDYSTSGFTVTVPCRSEGPSPDASGSLIDSQGFGYPFLDPYAVTFTGADYQQSYQAYRTFLAGGNNSGTYQGSQTFTASQFRSDIYACSVERAAANPLAGNAGSLQFQMVSAGLDPASLAGTEQAPHPTADGHVTMDRDDSQWGLGLSGGRVDQGGRAGYQISGRINRSFRILAGNRSLLIVDVPVNYQSVGGKTQVRLSAAVSLLVPITRRWTIEPRIAYGYVRAPQEQLSGRLGTVSLASRLFFSNVGRRGQLSVGSMVAYSRTDGVHLSGSPISAATTNWTLRGATAYELPLGRRILARQASVRASYAYMRFFGDLLFNRDLHEASFSIGVRGRGESARNSFETLRVGVNGAWAKAYNRYMAFVGYRF